jgi:hypothetical protein
MSREAQNLLIPFRRDKKRDFAVGSGEALLASKVRHALLTEGATARSSGELPGRPARGARCRARWAGARAPRACPRARDQGSGGRGVDPVMPAEWVSCSCLGNYLALSILLAFDGSAQRTRPNSKRWPTT